MVHPFLSSLATLLSIASAAQLNRKALPGHYYVEPGRGKCIDWGEGFNSCVTPRFNGTEHWMLPRPELTDAREVWQQRHHWDMQALIDGASSDGCGKVVLLGDSITERWNRPFFRMSEAVPATCFSCGSAPTKLQPGVATFAIGGDRIQDLGWRLFEDGGMALVKQCRPRDIVLTIGTNDYGFGEDVTVAEQELELLVKQIQKAKPEGSRLVLNAVFPRGDNVDRSWGCPDWDPVRHTQLNAVLAKLAVDEDTTYIDCSDIVNLTTKDAYEEDKLHLATAGYVGWNQCLKRAGVSPLFL